MSEKIIIGLAIMHSECFQILRNYGNVFIDEKYKDLYNIIESIDNDGNKINMSNIQAKKPVYTYLEIGELLKALPDKNTFEELLESQLLRHSGYQVNKTQAKLKNGEFKKHSEYITEIENNVSYTKTNETSNDISEIVQNFLQDYVDKKVMPRYLTGWDRVDKYGGHPKNAFQVIGARPGVGKTSLLVHDVISDIKNKYKPAIISYEMTKDEILQKLIANMIEVNERKIDLKELDNQEENRMSNCLERLVNSGMKIEENPDIDIDSLCRLIVKWDKLYNFDKYYIDYFGIIPCTKYRTELENLTYISKSLARTKKKIGKNIKLLAQLNRESEGTGREPTMKDLKGCGQLEQDADIIWFLHEVKDNSMTEEQLKDQIEANIKIIIAKFRRGSKGFINTKFLKKYSKFQEMF
jgi:replicative DNA helicase